MNDFEKTHFSIGLDAQISITSALRKLMRPERNHPQGDRPEVPSTSVTMILDRVDHAKSEEGELTQGLDGDCQLTGTVRLQP